MLKHDNIRDYTRPAVSLLTHTRLKYFVNDVPTFNEDTVYMIRIDLENDPKLVDTEAAIAVELTLKVLDISLKVRQTTKPVTDAFLLDWRQSADVVPNLIR